MRRSVPWRYGDLLALAGMALAGFAFVGVAAFASSRTSDLATQVRWTNVAVVGVIVLGVGNLLWLITGRRAVGELRRVLVPRLLAFESCTARAGVGAGDVELDAVAAFVSSRIMTKYHLRTCALVRDKAVRAASLAVHERRGRRPCGVCLPSAGSGV